MTQLSVQCSLLIVSFTRKFKTGKRPIRDTIRISVLLSVSSSIWNDSVPVLRVPSAREKLKQPVFSIRYAYVDKDELPNKLHKPNSLFIYSLLLCRAEGIVFTFLNSGKLRSLIESSASLLSAVFSLPICPLPSMSSSSRFSKLSSVDI